MLKLVQTDWGVFDLAFDESQEPEPAVATLVYAVLFTDAEGPEHRVPDRFDRRGWWADPEAGTGIWHVRRQPLNSAARREAMDMVRQALMDRDPGLSEVEVTEVASDAAGSVSGLFLRVAGLHNGRKFVVQTPL